MKNLKSLLVGMVGTVALAAVFVMPAVTQAAVYCQVTHGSTPATTYDGVSPSSDLCKAMQYLTSKNVMSQFGGYSQNSAADIYGVDSPVGVGFTNRAQAAAVVLKAFDTSNNIDINNPLDGSQLGFSDTPSGDKQWWYGYVLRAKQLGFVSGYADGTIRGGNNVSRAEFVKMFLAASPKKDDILNSNSLVHYFTDVPQFAWYAPYAEYIATQESMIKAFQDSRCEGNNFCPDLPITQVEAALMMYYYSQIFGDIGTGSTPATISNVNKRAVVIIYKNVYDALKPEIDNFQNDVLANLGVKVDVIQLQNSLTYTPLDIRNLLIKECQLDAVKGCSNLGGAVFVGDIPYALYEQPFDSNHLAPFMYFYEDLDASFKQNNLGHYYGYDSHGAHEGPEIYTGWIPSTFPATDSTNHINELRAYFQKHHNFFSKQTVPSKWAVSAIHVPDINHVYSILSYGLTVYGTANSIEISPDAVDNLAPFKAALLAELAKGPEVAYLHSHGSATVVWGLTASDFSNLTNLPLFMLTWGCDNGNFMEVENLKDSIVLAFIHGKNLGLSFLAKLDSNDIDVYSGNCPNCGFFVGNQTNFFKYYNQGQYVGEAWLNVEHDFAAYPLPSTAPVPTDPSSNAPNNSASESPAQLIDLYKLSGPLQRIIIGSPFVYSPMARK